MSKEIDDYINEQVAANRGTREQILQQFAKSDDAELTAYATNANKPKVEETKKTMMELLTTPHPMLGISPADVALYGGGAALAWQAGKKLADISIQGIGNIGGQIGNAIFGKAGASAPSPSASTQDLMATPNIDKPYPPDVQALIERSEANKAAKAADAMAKVSPLPAGMTPGIPTAQPNVSVNPTGAFTQPSGYSVATPAPVVQPSQFDPSRIGQPLQDPLAGGGFQTPQQEIGPRVPPSAVDTLATGGTPTQIANQTAAQAIDEIRPVATSAGVAPPEGMKPQYKPKKGEIGPGGYNWFASQVGPEQAPARWAEQYGEKNVPYKQVQSEYAATRYPVKPNPEGAKTGGAFGKPEHIPEYIKGHASMAGLLNVAGNALGIAGLAQEYKKAKKSGDWSDFGMGVANQLVSNVAPRAALPLALMTPGTTNAGEQEELARRRQMAPTISRAVPPPNQR